MTGAELGTICGTITLGLGGVGAALKWAANQITGAIERNTAALLGFTSSAVRLEGLIAGAHAAALRTEQAAEKTKEAVEEVADEVSGVVSTDEPPQRNTPVGGYPIPFLKRKPTRGGG